MKLSLKWASDYVDLSKMPSLKDYSDKLTYIGQKVEGYETLGADIENVKVGKIVSIEKHPDSGLIFEGYEVPGYQKCRDAVPMLHAQMPRFRLVSWDFAIDPDGEPVLIEANLHYGELDFHQINNGPIFGEDTEKILKEVFNKR